MSDASRSITHWFERFTAGDEDALGKIWELYFDRLVKQARANLKGYKPQAAGEVDIVQSVFRTFLRHDRKGDLPEFADAEHLWYYLARITVNKISDLRTREMTKKRGGGGVVRETSLQGGPDQSLPGIDGLSTAKKPIPAKPGGAKEKLGGDALGERMAIENEVQAADEKFDAEVRLVLKELMSRLEHEDYRDLHLREIAELTIQGETPENIAARLKNNPVVVKRKLRMIRKIWFEGV